LRCSVLPRFLAQRSRRSLLAASAALLPLLAGAAADPGAGSAPRTEFAPPAAGSYTLPHIQGVPDAALLDAAGRAQRLRNLAHGRITLLTFFYTSCADPLGCPFVFSLLRTLQGRLREDPLLARQVRFISLSLDPRRDTPAALSRYAGTLGAARDPDWRFLTARSVPELLPVLDEFGQDVSIERDADGAPTRVVHHMLKVFLIDRAGSVREIYSLAFLQPAVILNDIRTLAMERPPASLTPARPL
jgi:protein SCO1